MLDGLSSQFIGLLCSMIGAVVLAIVWAIRQEGRINYLERYQNKLADEIKTLTIKHENLDSEIVRELSKVKESLARIEGFLKASE